MAFSRGLGYGQRVKRLVSRISQCGIAILTLRHKRAKNYLLRGKYQATALYFMQTYSHMSKVVGRFVVLT